ncbi:MAG: hypothetical protein KBT34_09145 [Prevotella sp.]|nr:hypothetical protein [Candidatus Prevotella equi]
MAWYEESKTEYSQPMTTRPIVFERDETGRISKATKKEVARAGSDVSVSTVSIEFTYDAEGHLIESHDSEREMKTMYKDFNKNGAPEKIVNAPDSTIVTYFDFDKNGNWLKVSHSCKYSFDDDVTKKFYERIITYYKDKEDGTEAEKEAAKYKQAIIDLPNVIVKEMEQMKSEYDELGDWEDNDVPMNEGDNYQANQGQQITPEMQQDYAILNYIGQCEREAETLQPALNDAMARYNAAKVRYGATNMSMDVYRRNLREVLSQIVRKYHIAMINAKDLNDDRTRMQLVDRYEQLYDYYNEMEGRVHSEGMPR